MPLQVSIGIKVYSGIVQFSLWCDKHMYASGLENLGFRFLGFNVERKPNTILWPTKNILYAILPVTLFSENYKNIHKSLSKHEIRYYSIKLHKKI